VSGNNFSSWSGAVSSTSNPICVPGVNGGTDLQVTANYVTATRATTATLARTTGSATSTYGDSLTFTATVGTIGGAPTTG
jgi:hypothetical protein